MRSKHLSGFVAAALVLCAGEAFGSTALDSPDSGVVQMGRGGAWLVRADDPLAAFFNPAALVRQPYGVTLGSHVMFGRRCFTRQDSNGDPAAASPNVLPPGTACEKEGVFFNPQVGASFRVHEMFSIGLAVLGPHGVGRHEWPETVPWTNEFGVQQQPGPQRFMLVSSASTILLPTLSVAFSPVKEFAIGVGFISGIALADFVNFSEGVSPAVPPGVTPRDNFYATGEVRARLSAFDPFVPGFVVSALWAPTRNVEMSAWFKWLDSVEADGNLDVQSLYWNNNGTKNETPCANMPNDPDCNVTKRDGAGKIKLHLPLEAKVGMRYRHPLPGGNVKTVWGTKRGNVADSLSQDLFDIEINFTYANNSAGDVCANPTQEPCTGQKGAGIFLRFQPNIPVKGTPGYLPTIADVPHMWKDVVGVRVGGDFTVIPNRLALRAGGWYETAAGTPEWLNVDFHAAEKGGVAGGITVRVGNFDFNAGYQHTFFGTLDNKGAGKLRGLSGDVSAGSRTQQVVNGGKLESEINEFGLSSTARW